MAITTAMCTSFKSDSATLSASTTAYATTNEVSATGTGYTAGGNTLTNVDPTTSGPGLVARLLQEVA